MSTPFQPTQEVDRFESLDVLRGLAVLGILMVNVQFFAMVPSAGQYPPAMMDLTGANLTAWFITHVFFELKFITIFSAMFGAGLVLMLGEEKEAPRGLHNRRMAWLLVFGLIHGTVFWYGDILLPYAIMGFVVVLFRHMSARKLFIWGGVWIALNGIVMIAMLAFLQLLPPEKTGLVMPADTLENVVAAYQAGFMDRLAINALNELQFAMAQSIMFAGRLIGVMFIGMALLKTGFLKADWSFRRYAIASLIGLGVGLSLTVSGAMQAIRFDFAIDHLWVHAMTNYIGSLFVAFGYASLVMLAVKLPALGLVRYPFRQAGRMAFTNYLGSTLIMTFLFVGPPGLGWFGTVERAGQIQIVLITWIFLLGFSVLWMHFFRIGPMEWLWRSLSYQSLQPLRRKD